MADPGLSWGVREVLNAYRGGTTGGLGGMELRGPSSETFLNISLGAK